MTKAEKRTQDQAMDISTLSSGGEGGADREAGEKPGEHGVLGAKGGEHVEEGELSVSYTHF